MTQSASHMERPTTETPSPKKTVITVNAPLHAKLKAKAAHEGRVMQRMVEEKLEELFEPAQLELVATDSR